MLRNFRRDGINMKDKRDLVISDEGGELLRFHPDDYYSESHKPEEKKKSFDRKCPKCGWLGMYEVPDKATSIVGGGFGIGGSAPTTANQSWCPKCGTKTEFYKEK